MIIWYIFKNNKSLATIQVSGIQPFLAVKKSLKLYLRHALFILRMLALASLITIIARPQSTSKWQNTITEGIDIVLALDISGSMLAQDFKPDRLEASKDVATEFISGRPLDRIGLVVFSGESFTQCPITSDHPVLINLLREVHQGIIEDGTAIGLGLANAISRIKDSKSKSRVIILLTDGVNNMGEVAPVTAADIAATYGIRVYTIGVGRNGFAPYPVQTVFGIQYQDMEVKIDEEVLKEKKKKTDGKYFRATNNQKLKEIYQEIDKLEKSKIEVKKYSNKQEEYLWFAILAAFVLLLEILLKNTYLRNIP